MNSELLLGPDHQQFFSLTSSTPSALQFRGPAPDEDTGS